MDSFAEYLAGLSIYAVKKTAAYFLNEKTKYIELHDKLVDQDQKTEEHFKVLLEADMKVAVYAFERGLKLAAASRSEEGAWKSKFEVALEKSQEGFATVPRTEQKIKCYDIMCVCFLALNKDDEARNTPLRNKQDFGDLIRYSRDIFKTSSPTMVLLGFILIATLLSLWLLHDTLTSQESDESSSTTIMNYIYAFINLLDVQSVGEHLIQYEKGGIGSLE
jgi:hypothetical protein